MDVTPMAIRESIDGEEWQSLADIARERFGVCVSSRDLRNACEASKRGYGGNAKKIETPVEWLKLRLMQIGAFASKGNIQVVRVKCELHIFFPCLEETEDMLALLAWDEEQIQQAEARSKIFATNLVPRPIDTVAQRVSGITSRAV